MKNEVIAEVLAEETVPAQPCGEIIDAKGYYLIPGVIDDHVHFRDPGFTYKEDIETGAAAAARGGFTMVVCMANTKPAVDNLETLKYIQDKGAKTGIHVVQTATVTKGLAGKELVDMDSLAAAGAAGFTDDGIPIMDEKLLLEAMEKARDLDLPVSLHEEDPLFIVQPGVNQGKCIRKAWIRRCIPHSGGYYGCKGLRPCTSHRCISVHTAYKLRQFRGYSENCKEAWSGRTCGGNSTSFHPYRGCCAEVRNHGAYESSTQNRERQKTDHRGNTGWHNRYDSDGSRPAQQ